MPKTDSTQLLERAVQQFDEIEDALSEAREALGQGRLGDCRDELQRAIDVLDG
jgi:hypothetical protein